MRYYVYMYLDTDNVPFYVGKGKNDRYQIRPHLYSTYPNRFLVYKIRKVGVANIKIHFLHKNLTEEEAFYWESYWIKYIGRRDKKEGTLCNLTNGGEGNSGRIQSNETRQKISNAAKGEKNPMYGKSGYWKDKKMSNEHKQKMCNAKKGEKNPMYRKSPSKETRQKASNAMKGEKNPMYGKFHSDVAKQKISKSAQGRKHSNKTKQEISATLKTTLFLKKQTKNERCVFTDNESKYE